MLADFLDKATQGSFSEAEIRAAAPLIALAEPDEAKREEKLLALADDADEAGASGSANLDRLIASTSGKPRKRRPRRDDDSRTAQSTLTIVPPGQDPATLPPPTDPSALPGVTPGKPGAPAVKRDTKQSNKLVKDARAALAAGKRKEAEQAIGDTFFFTNCSPQHARLNQQTWLSLEEYVLKNAATQKLKVCVFSGPVFQEQDRSYRGVQIPEEYWKVVSIINDFTNRLSVTAYVISQANYLGDVEFAFGEFRTYQVPVSEIQARTGLDFGELLRHDPLAQIEGAPHREIRSGDDLLL